jgi:uncharacterized protein YbjT (DUF2867 family)
MTSHDRTVLVTGATGRQGGATTRRLLADGWAVRALVRDPSAGAARALATAGAELVTADMDDPASLARAVAGAHGVFLVPPVAFGPTGPDDELEAARGRAVVDAAGAAGVAHVVFTGVASMTRRPTPIAAGKAGIEAHLRESGRTWTVLRPVRFMTNYLGVGLPIDGLQDGGRGHLVNRHLFAPDEPMQIIAVDDIAAFAAAAFADPERYAGRTLELAGDSPTPLEAVQAISAATGLDVRYERLDRAAAERIAPVVGRVLELVESGERYHADIEVLRVLHPGMLTLQGWLDRGGAEQIRRATSG